MERAYVTTAAYGVSVVGTVQFTDGSVFQIVELPQKPIRGVRTWEDIQASAGPGALWEQEVILRKARRGVFLTDQSVRVATVQYLVREINDLYKPRGWKWVSSVPTRV